MPGALVALIARQALDEGPTCTSWLDSCFTVLNNVSQHIGMRLVLHHCE